MRGPHGQPVLSRINTTATKNKSPWEAEDSRLGCHYTRHTAALHEYAKNTGTSKTKPVHLLSTECVD